MIFITWFIKYDEKMPIVCCSMGIFFNY
jgi:hypothetical protein